MKSLAVAVIADRTAYWQTIKPVSVRSLRTTGTHDSIRCTVMKAPKLYLLKRDH